jgi:O-succinylbenzoic acid--CoA ligase
MAVEDWLSAAARQRADHTFLETETQAVTFSEAERSVGRFAAGLRQRGVAGGVRVGVYGPNSVEMVLGIFSILRAGGVVVPLGSRFTKTELVQQVVGTGVGAVLSVAGQMPDFGVPILELLDSGGETVLGGVHHDAEECAVVHTSGSSGSASGVRLSWGNFETSARASAKHLGHTADDRWLLVLPVHHVGGLSVLVRSARQGSTVVLRESFNPQGAARDLGNVTLASFVPTMLSQVLPFLDSPPADLRAVLLGGGPVPSSLLAAAVSRGLIALPTYGQTEASSQIATLPLEGPAGALQPIKDMAVRVVGGSGAALTRDLVGEVEIRGPQVFLGYEGGPSRKATDWHRTGDLGSIDSRGFLQIAGRSDDVILSGGENVHPVEVADALIRAGARDAAVFGVPNDTWGEVVSAAVVTQLPLKELEKSVRRELAGYKVPKRWVLVDSVPRNSMGKVRRDKLRGLLNE